MQNKRAHKSNCKLPPPSSTTLTATSKTPPRKPQAIPRNAKALDTYLLSRKPAARSSNANPATDPNQPWGEDLHRGMCLSCNGHLRCLQCQGSRLCLKLSLSGSLPLPLVSVCTTSLELLTMAQTNAMQGAPTSLSPTTNDAEQQDNGSLAEGS